MVAGADQVTLEEYCHLMLADVMGVVKGDFYDNDDVRM